MIRVQGKYLDYPEQHTNPYIKNYAQGFRFRTPDRKLNASRITAATNAVAALGLLFGAVDLLIGEDGNEYVLEVNTAPKLAPLTCSQYVGAIREYFGIGEGVVGATAQSEAAVRAESRESDADQSPVGGTLYGGVIVDGGISR